MAEETQPLPLLPPPLPTLLAVILRVAARYDRAGEGEIVPWTPKQATKHNHSVKSPKRKRQWSSVANSILEKTGDDARAIRGANSAVKKSQSKRSRRRS